MQREWSRCSCEITKGIDIADVAAVCGKPLFGLPTADPGIEQQSHAARFHVDAVSVLPD
jgi:hypothetical protein